MKILVLSPLPPPSGGIASWTKNILGYYSVKQKGLKLIHQNTAIKYREITNINMFSRIVGGYRSTISVIKNLLKNIAMLDIDVIHLTSSGSFALLKDLLILYIASKKSIPVVVHFHFGRIPQLVNNKNWEWYLLYKVIKKSNQVIVLDDTSYNLLCKEGFNNIANIANPISIKLELLSKELRLSEVSNYNIGRIVFIGHVVATKGVFELVRSCIELEDVKELVIIGSYETDIKNELEKLANVRDNGKWLNFTGNIDKENVYKELQQATILVLPSYTEGFPNVIIEAMAMGCPVIGTAVGAIPEMLDVKTDIPCGICVPPMNILELSSSIKTLLENKNLRDLFKERAIHKVLNSYTLDSLSKKYETLWFSCNQ
jgi:glycosyltransferase involved in cell wall biosynthesis